MKVAIFALFVAPLVAFAQSAAPKINGLYVKTFGDSAKPALVYVHGGPGYNSYDFETTTAQRLADKGYFVVVYDQRGQGRSDSVWSPADYSYASYARDLKDLISSLNLKDPVLLGHSHGGAISIKFDELNPGIARKVILVSAPVNMWGTMSALYRNCTDKFARFGRTDLMDRMTKSYVTLAFNNSAAEKEREDAVADAFQYAFACGVYNVAQPTADAQKLQQLLVNTPLQGPLTGELDAMPGFLRNENYVRVNLFEQVRKNRTRYYGVYGDEDGLFDRLQLNVIKLSLASGNFRLVPRASHAVYIDQQDAFLNAVDEFAKQ